MKLEDIITLKNKIEVGKKKKQKKEKKKLEKRVTSTDHYISPEIPSASTATMG